MKKAYLEISIENTVKLVRHGVPTPVILFALKSDGLTHDKALTIIRWAQLKLKEENV